MKLVSALVAALPAGGQSLLGNLLGRVFWLVTPAWRKRLAAGQIKTCLGVTEAVAWRIARASVLKYGGMIVEVLCFPRLTAQKVREQVLFPDESYFKSLFAGGNGVVLASAHFGNWELHGAALALLGYKMACVAQKQHNGAMDRFINEYRARAGLNVTYRQSVLEMVRLLGAGFGLGLLSDQDGGKDGVTVEFFGRPSCCPKGPAALARLKKAPLVLTLLRQRPDGRREIFVSPPIAVARSGDRERDIAAATAELMLLLEGEIRKEPALWFWLHNRWKVSKKIYQ
jgi:KDO2-lipid IV(A) lauroyltransferase